MYPNIFEDWTNLYSVVFRESDWQKVKGEFFGYIYRD